MRDTSENTQQTKFRERSSVLKNSLDAGSLTRGRRPGYRLLLLDASGLMALKLLPHRALEVASAGMIVGFAAWAVRMLVGRS
jgi:hypothetical protein